MKLHEQVKVLKEREQALQDGLISIRRYCNSGKFSQDIMINKNDILLRIDEILIALDRDCESI